MQYHLVVRGTVEDPVFYVANVIAHTLHSIIHYKIYGRTVLYYELHNRHS
jgi:hypothetical protein